MSLSPLFDLVSQNGSGERGRFSETCKAITVTILFSSGMNTKTPQVNGRGVMGWRTGHLQKTGECANGASLQLFQLSHQYSEPHLSLYPRSLTFQTYSSQMSGNDIKISEDERWFKGDIDVDTVEISEVHW